MTDLVIIIVTMINCIRFLSNLIEKYKERRKKILIHRTLARGMVRFSDQSLRSVVVLFGKRQLHWDPFAVLDYIADSISQCWCAMCDRLLTGEVSFARDIRPSLPWSDRWTSHFLVPIFFLNIFLNIFTVYGRRSNLPLSISKLSQPFHPQTSSCKPPKNFNSPHILGRRLIRCYRNPLQDSTWAFSPRSANYYRDDWSRRFHCRWKTSLFFLLWKRSMNVFLEESSMSIQVCYRGGVVVHRWSTP